MRKYGYFLMMLWTLPWVSHGGLFPDYSELKNYLGGQYEFREGSFAGTGASGAEYQLTLLDYSPGTPGTFVAILEKFKKGKLEVSAARAFHSNLINSLAQMNLHAYVFDADFTTVIPPPAGEADMTLSLQPFQNSHMRLKLKPLKNDSNFNEDIYFSKAKAPRILRNIEPAQFSKEGSNITITKGNVGDQAELTVSGKPTAGGDFRVAAETFPGLFVMRKLVSGRYLPMEDNQISYVVYFTRRCKGGNWLQKHRGHKHTVVTLPDLSRLAEWELER